MNTQETTKQVRLPFFGIPRLWPFIRPYRYKILLMIVLGALVSAADALYPLFNRYALEHFVGGNTLKGIGGFVAVYLGVLFVQALLNFKSAFDCGQIEMKMNRDLRNAAFNHLQTLSFSYFNQNAVGYLHARVMSDTGLIGELVSWRMMDCIWSGSFVIGVLAVMLFTNPRLTAYVLLPFPAAILLMMYFQKKLLSYNRRIREINSTITGDFNEGITGELSVKVLHVQQKMTEEFGKDNSSMRRTSVREAHFSALLISSVSMMSSVVLALVLWKGGRLTREGLMQIGTLSVFMSYALELLEPVQTIVETLAAVLAIQVNIERLTNLLEEKSDVADTPEVIAR